MSPRVSDVLTPCLRSFATALSCGLLLPCLAVVGCSSASSSEPQDPPVPEALVDAAAGNDARQRDAGPAVDARIDSRVTSIDAGIDVNQVSVDATPASDASDAPAPIDAAVSGDADPWELYDAGPPVVAVTDSNGWSVLPGLPGTAGGYARAIYVDSVNGSETNTGDSPTAALQHLDGTSTLYKQLSTAAAGQTIVVVLKPGSSWPTEKFDVPIGGTEAFPLLITGTRWPGASGARPGVGGMIYLNASHVAIEGLEIGPGGTYDEGIHIPVNGGTDFLIEDCLITHFYNLIEVTGSHTQPVSNLRIRRNYLFGAYGSGPVVAFDGNDISSALFEENFFDWNGGPTGDYTNTSLTASYSNVLAHDVYFADDGTGVVALNVTFRHNLFSRTLESVKGPYSGTLDDNLFYNYSSGGYIGTWGGELSNNVLIDGGGFASALDNNHSPNTLPSRKTLVCNNLSYNEGTPYSVGAYAFETLNTAGVNLDFTNNVIDGFDRAFNLSDTHCFGVSISTSLIQANSFYELWSPWPQAACSASFTHNTYHSPMGDTSASQSGYALKQNPANTYSDFSALESFLDETGSSYQTAPIAFADPTRNIGSYLTSTSLATASSAPTLISYLKLLQTQAATAHQWNESLGVAAVNAYIRAGHASPTLPLTYGTGCP